MQASEAFLNPATDLAGFRKGELIVKSPSEMYFVETLGLHFFLSQIALKIEFHILL